MPTQSFQDPMQGAFEVLVQETADAGVTYSSGSADNAFIQSARAQVPYPKLKQNGIFHWHIVGQIVLLASANTVEVQVMIDGAAVSTVMSFPTGVLLPSGSTFILDVWISPLASAFANKEQQQAISARMTYHDGTAHVTTLHSSATMTVDTQTPAGHTMGLQIRKTLATVNHFLTLHSQNCFRHGGMSGS